MITTTLAEIRAHEPCASSWKTLLAALGPTYGDDTPLPLARIVETNGIDDALWALRTQHDGIAKLIAVTFTCDCAERAQPKFDAKYPDDERPRKAIKAGRAWVREPTEENRKAAARAAVDAAAAAADDAADAARYAAYVAVAAADAAAELEWQKARLKELLS